MLVTTHHTLTTRGHDTTASSPPSCFRPRATAEVGSVKVFKKASGEFRSQEISAEEYYATCQSIFEDRMDEVLQELVALLPDINMQQELAFVHRRANPMVSIGWCRAAP